MTVIINIPIPELQISFASILEEIKSLYLQDALKSSIEKVDLKLLDNELSIFVPEQHLKNLARNGLRGELIYSVPCILKANPSLLGYYRLLLGFSQKEFYCAGFGTTSFKSMEVKGLLSQRNAERLPALCEGLVGSAVALVAGIGTERLSQAFLGDLTLLTLGPQLRGGANVKKGIAGIVEVFQAIHNIVEHAVIHSTASRIEIVNAAGRKVLIEFAPDPDIVIREEMSQNSFRNIIAIEIKGGTDFSNIHNRVGEAEKSHQKAKSVGYVECWTVVNVDRIDIEMAMRESPTTNNFFRLSALKQCTGSEYTSFKERVISLTGIKNK